MIRLMSYNIEWSTRLFDADNNQLTSAEASGRLSAIASVISSIDPDLIGIVEAPNTTTTTGNRSTVAALEGFAADHGLRQRKAMIGFASPGEQEIALLYDPDKLAATHDPGGKADNSGNLPFNEKFEIDSDQDGIKEIYRHYRPPLEAKITTPQGADLFWLMVVHTKSKGIFDMTDRVHFERISERNRRKLFAECTSIRQRVKDWLDQDRPVVVMGDVNDGAGFDYYEGRFGRSAVEIIMGDLFAPDDILRNYLGAPEWGRYGWKPSTVRFKDQFTGSKVNALIDHILASRHLIPAPAPAPALAAMVWNPFQNDAAKPLKNALIDASDHFPVTLDLA